MRRRHPDKSKLTDWQRSAEFRILANAALRRYNQRRADLPKCGALARSSGQPCRQLAMANGRCWAHGGLTPSGPRWHVRQWPKGAAPDAMEKLGRKLKKADRDQREKAERLEAMEPEERAEFDRWQKTHSPGPSAQRAALRREARQNAEARELLARAGNPTPKDAALQGLIDTLETAREAATRKRLEDPTQKDIFS